MKFKFMLSCKEAARLLSDKLEYPLPLSKRIYLTMHVAMCNGCNLYGRQIKGLKNLISRRTEIPEESPASCKSSLSEETRERMKTLLNKKNS